MTQGLEEIKALHSNGVMIVETDEDNIRYLKTIFEFLDCSAFFSKSVDEMLDQLDGAASQCTAVVSGTGLSEREHEDLLKVVSQRNPRLPVFMAFKADGAAPASHGSHGDVLGNLVLPTRLEVVVNLLHKAQVFVENQHAAEGGRRPLELFRSLTGNSRATKRINQMIQQVANSDATVLILGESGTGKEVVARKLHYHSDRRGKPFVPVNCGAIPGDLLESELFGHEKGAFTGAISARQGRFEMAEGGTLFLDEIGDMSMHMQVKLLRVLQERTFERVGSNRTQECDVRIIAATHRNLEQAIKDGKFREDLFYRLNVFPIDMPPLRDRVADIPLLVNDLINRIENEKRGSVRLTPAAVTALSQYRWPGNVRELANLIERLAILYPYGVVDVNDLPEKFREGINVAELVKASKELPEVTVSGGDPNTVETVPRLPVDGLDLKAHLNEMEQNLIRQALDEADGVVAHAAKRLKMRRTTLVEKLRKYGLHRGQEVTGI